MTPTQAILTPLSVAVRVGQGATQSACYSPGRCLLATENRRLQAELKWVTKERDILKKAAAYFARGKGKVRVHAGASR